MSVADSDNPGGAPAGLLDPARDRRRARRAAQQRAPAPRRRWAPTCCTWPCRWRRAAPSTAPCGSPTRPRPSTPGCGPRGCASGSCRSSCSCIVAAVGMVFARGVTRPVRQPAAGGASPGRRDLAVRVDADDGATRAARRSPRRSTPPPSNWRSSSSPSSRFVADASHQLRTPLTALRLRLETLAPSSPSRRSPKLDAAIAETNRLGRLVHSLLVLARSDADRGRTGRPSTSPPRSPTASTPGRRSPPTKDVRWSPSAPHEPVGHAVPGAVEQILDNLVSNALDAAPDATAVTIRVVAGRRHRPSCTSSTRAPA